MSLTPEEKVAAIDASALSRFWAQVQKQGQIPQAQPELGCCWEWTGRSIHGFGYGVMHVGRRTQHYITGAHRISWMIHHGAIPAGIHVCHKCDRPLCVNPAHLFLGTASDNLADMHEKGRTARGFTKPNTKLSREEDHDRVRRARSLGLRLSDVAWIFGVSEATVSLIVSRKR